MNSKFTDEEILRHTAALWKYKAVPSQNRIPEPATEYQSECHTIGDWQVIGASVRGKMHKHEGTNRDDWFETENVHGFFVSAVSDGAGSKKFSRIGSRTSCRAAVLFIKNQLTKLLTTQPRLLDDLSQNMDSHIFVSTAGLLTTILQKAMQTARDAVVSAYESRRNEPHYTAVIGRELVLSDFAATLLLTLAVPLPKIDEVLVVACQVGDGITAVLNTRTDFDNSLTLLGIPDGGDFSGETDFLTSPKMAFTDNLMNRTRLSRKPMDLIFSMTDGVADDYDPNERELHRLYFDLIANRILMCHSFVENSNFKIPEAQMFPKVEIGDETRLAPIQFTTDLMAQNSLTLADVWKNPKPLSVMAEKIPLNSEQNSAVRLLEWLDNYTVRGSFDDRTLVIFRKKGDTCGQ